MASSILSHPKSGVRVAQALGGFLLLLALACGGSPGATGGERGPGGTTNTDPNKPWKVQRDDAGRLIVGYDDAGDAITVFDDAGRFTAAAATFGPIAVDDRDETAYVVQAFPTRAFIEEMDGGATVADPFTVKTLWALRADQPTAREVERFDHMGGTSVSFPRGGVLLASESFGPGGRGCVANLRLYDVGARRSTRQREGAPCVSAASLSAARNWLAMYEGQEEGYGVAIVDGSTLDVARVPLPDRASSLVGLSWLGAREALVVATSRTVRRDGGLAYEGRLTLWDLSGVTTGSVARALPGLRPALSVTLSDASSAVDAPFSVRVSPDDRYAVVSSHLDRPGEILGFLAGRPQLHVVDLRSGAARLVEGAGGPVGFTPDGSTIVAYRRDVDGRRYTATDFDGGDVSTANALVLIDLETFRRSEIAVPVEGPPLFFVTRMGHRVLVTSTDHPGDLLLVDLQMRRLTRLSKNAPPINNFVSREGGRELWLLGRGLHRLDLLDGTLESVPLDWNPGQINILPTRDLFIMTRVRENALSFWSPATRTTTRTVRLPIAGQALSP